jgi:hypothetical protein
LVNLDHKLDMVSNRGSEKLSCSGIWGDSQRTICVAQCHNTAYRCMMPDGRIH